MHTFRLTPDWNEIGSVLYAALQVWESNDKICWFNRYVSAVQVTIGLTGSVVFSSVQYVDLKEDPLCWR